MAFKIITQKKLIIMNNIPSDADTESEDIKTIYFEDQVLDFDFHPTKRYLVSSLVSGQIFG
jgi:hypothetical protein